MCDLPVRAAKFVPRKNWVVSGSDDMHVRVFNYNTLERIHQFEAHSDYIRCIAIHPSSPFILTSSDDMLIKVSRSATNATNYLPAILSFGIGTRSGNVNKYSKVIVIT